MLEGVVARWTPPATKRSKSEIEIEAEVRQIEEFVRARRPELAAEFAQWWRKRLLNQPRGIDKATTTKFHNLANAHGLRVEREVLVKREWGEPEPGSVNAGAGTRAMPELISSAGQAA